MQIVEELLDVKKIVRKPQYIMASETPLLLFHCGYQGLSFRCHPGIYMQDYFYRSTKIDVNVTISSMCPVVFILFIFCKYCTGEGAHFLTT